jgi:hypothetical protein
LLFESKDKKYVALIDISSDKPTTGLTIKLRPRYSITGRLVDLNGTPFVNRQFTMYCQRHSDFGDHFPGIHPFGQHAELEKFHSETCTTDADGFFAVHRIIPGADYMLRVRSPVQLDMPILQPEQYQEPYSLGDVVVQ